MAKTSGNNIKDISVDWGRDPENGLPFSGAAVQRFIKEQLGGKAGYFHSDTDNERYLVFADQASAEAYLSDPEGQSSLLLGSFDAPANYTMRISLLTPGYNAIRKGTTGNAIRFSFTTVERSGGNVSEEVVVTYTISNGTNVRVLTETRTAGEVVEFNVDRYLQNNTNYVTVNVRGRQTLASTSQSVTFRVFDLGITDAFDIARVRTISDGALNTIDVPFSLTGSGTAYMEYFIDGQKVQAVATEDTIVLTEGMTAARTRLLAIDGLSEGKHSLQVRSYLMDSQTSGKFHTETLYREFIVSRGTLSKALVTVRAELPPGSDIVTDPKDLVMSGFTQYAQANVGFSAYNPRQHNNVVTVTLSGDGAVQTYTMNTENGRTETFPFTPKGYDAYTLTFEVAGTSTVYRADVGATQLSIREITGGLLLNLDCEGKSNSAGDRSEWSYGDIRSELTGFRYDSNDGWQTRTYTDNGQWIEARRLVIPEGRKAVIGANPMAYGPTTGGMTLEVDFSVDAYAADDAVVCDMRDGSGAGILITATEATLTTTSGKSVTAKYMAGDNVRLTFVVYPQTAPTNYQSLYAIYVDGVISAGAKYSGAEGFAGADAMSFGSDGLTVNLKQVRAYRTALDWSNVINNLFLYQDTVSQMVRLYGDNDIYDENGAIDLNKLANRCPCLKITGDYKTLDSFTDKKSNITVDAEYTNNQDATRSFRAVDLYLRGQGTSSMFYPVKNLRPNFTKGGNTRLYDAEGNLVEDNLYSHKEGSARVNEYTLKADFAESSGTHNAGVARFWGDCLYWAQMNVADIAKAIKAADGVDVTSDTRYILRTQVQRKAEAEKWPYDVRTTVDGFPITVVCRESASDQWNFRGHYNFLNDKSNEKVFGFNIFPEDFPRMQCWEFLDSSNSLALFKPGQDFDAGWRKAWEARYPDLGDDADTTDLKAFYAWLSGVSEADFRRQKWEHLDMFNIAAYYVYLMRFGSVDQTVKNAMLMSEDGTVWKFINYDNDTIFGVKNDGTLKFGPYIDRQTLDPSESTRVYCYAGHDSRLWNLLEADTTFMDILVPAVDSALMQATGGEYGGLRWRNVVRLFNEDYMGAWNERIYNLDAENKYLSHPEYLASMQGSRKTHRRWWTSVRWALYDSKWQTGDYKDNSIACKFAGTADTPTKEVRVVAGRTGHYGYGINKETYAHTDLMHDGDAHTFVLDTSELLNIGNPYNFYSAFGLRRFDVSALLPLLSEINITNAVSERLSTQLQELQLGADTADGASALTNGTLGGILGLNTAVRLAELNIRGCQGMQTIDLSGNPKLRVLKAHNSGLVSASFATGAPLETLELPSTVTALSLDEVATLGWDGITFGGAGLGGNVRSLVLRDCGKLNGDWETILAWYRSLGNASDASLEMTGIHWEMEGVGDLVKLSNGLGKVSLAGRIDVIGNVTQELIEAIVRNFGTDVFNENNDLYIHINGVFLVGDTDVKCNAGATAMVLIGTESSAKEITWDVIGNGRIVRDEEDQTRATYYPDIFVNAETATTQTATVIATVELSDGSFYTNNLIVTVRSLVMATSVKVDGNTIIAEGENYEYRLVPNVDVDVDFRTVWTMDEHLQKFASFFRQEGKSASVNCAAIGELGDEDYEGVMTAVIQQSYRGVDYGDPITATASVSFNTTKVRLTFTTGDMTCVLRYSGLLLVTGSGNKWGSLSNSNNIGTMCGRGYLKQVNIGSGITGLGDKAFSYCTSLQRVQLPDTCTNVGQYTFEGCEALADINLGKVKTIGYNCFSNCKSLVAVDLSEWTETTRIYGGGFHRTYTFQGTALKEVYAPNFNSWTSNLFDNCKQLKKVHMPKLESLRGYAFYGCDRLEEVYLDSVTGIDADAFCYVGTTLAVVHFPKLESVNKGWSGNNRWLGDKPNMREIVSGVIAASGDYVNENAFYNTGVNNKGKGINKLYVPTGATGYDEGYWTSVLLNPDVDDFELVYVDDIESLNPYKDGK